MNIEKSCRLISLKFIHFTFSFLRSKVESFTEWALVMISFLRLQARSGQARNCKNLPHNESVSGRSTKTGTLVYWNLEQDIGK